MAITSPLDSMVSLARFTVAGMRTLLLKGPYVQETSVDYPQNLSATIGALGIVCQASYFDLQSLQLGRSIFLLYWVLA